jgi:hypothetical protein
MRQAVLYPVFMLGIILAGESQEFNPAEFAYNISQKDLGDDGWKKFEKRARERCEDYQNDAQGGSVDNFLNDRLADLANEVSDIASLKKFVNWLALYSAWKIELPPRAQDGFNKHKQELISLSKDFSWEKLLVLVQGPENKK